MIIIKYTYEHLNDVKGSQYERSLPDFLLRLPALGLAIKYSKAIPPICVVNELLAKGKLDAGMGGCFSWTPTQIDQLTYQELVNSMLDMLGDDVIVFTDESVTLEEWALSVMELHRQQRGEDNDVSN